MFKFSELRRIHLEITNNCQASCPMCSRNINGGRDNPLIQINNWTLANFKNTINFEVLENLEGINFCGNFGDPLLNNDLLDMVQYVVSTNPAVSIHIHTNGSLRNTAWWAKLAKVLPSQHVVVFAIDGLNDTHGIYRIGTDYNQIIRNASAFIQAGGIAEWTFIRFKHNAHEVESARSLASELGFTSFVMKDSSRFVIDTKFPAIDNQGQITHYLEPASESKIVFLKKQDISNYKKIAADSTIDCYALKYKEIYIDAFERVFPCCWIASAPYNYIDTETDVAHVRQEILKQYHMLVADLGGLDNIDTKNKSVKEIIDSVEYQTVWDKYWHDEKLITCARTCGVNKFSKPRDQFIISEVL